MTRVLKPSDTDAAILVRPFAWPTGDRPVAAAEPQLDPELARLRAERAQLEAELDALRASVRAQCEAAREHGAREAEKHFRARDDERLEELKGAIETALKDTRQALAGLDRAAFAVAETALQSVLGDAARYSDLIACIVRRQAGALQHHLILSVRVSAEDFPDATALDQLQAGLAGHAATLVATHDLAPGVCQIKLSLGELEIDLPRFWDELSTLLRDLTHLKSAGS